MTGLAGRVGGSSLTTVRRPALSVHPTAGSLSQLETRNRRAHYWHTTGTLQVTALLLHYY